MTQPLCHLLPTLARENAGHAFLQDEATRVQGAGLFAIYRSLTHGLVAAGVTEGSVVAVSTWDPILALTSALACGRLGATWMAASPDLMAHLDDRITHRFQTEDRQAFSWDKAQAFKDIMEMLPPNTPRAPKPAIDGAAPWIVTMASGPSVSKRPISISHAGMAARVDEALPDLQGFRSRVACVFDCLSMEYLEIAMAVLRARATLVSSGDPAFWTAEGITHVASTPAFWAEIAQRPLDLPDASAVLYGLGTDSGTIDTLSAAFGSVQEVYANRVTGPIGTRRYAPAEDANGPPPITLGSARVRILDQDGTAQPHGTEGMVAVQTPGTPTDVSLDPRIAQDWFRDGFMITGETGQLTDDGLVLTGRLHDTLQVDGRDVNASALDAALTSVDGIRDAAVFLVPREGESDRLTAFLAAEPEGQHEPGELILNARIRVIQLGFQAFVPEKFLFITAIPKLETGRPDRALCRDLLLRRRARGG